jgi:hypothetical protein
VILFVSMVVGGGVAWERGQIVGPSKGSIQALVVPHSQCSVQFSVTTTGSLWWVVFGVGREFQIMFTRTF